MRHLLLGISNHRGFYFGRKIVCLIFLKADLYLTLTEGRSNAFYLWFRGTQPPDKTPGYGNGMDPDSGKAFLGRLPG
jgi:hypothetical protein